MPDRVFVVTHIHALPGGVEDCKFIGVYSTRENAETAASRTSRLPGFLESSDGFCVDEYTLDRDYWTEGFSTVSD